MFATYKGMSVASTPAYVFSKIYLYIFIGLFIYVVLSVFISLISDTYETLHVSNNGGGGYYDKIRLLGRSKANMGAGNII